MTHSDFPPRVRGIEHRLDDFGERTTTDALPMDLLYSLTRKLHVRYVVSVVRRDYIGTHRTSSNVVDRDTQHPGYYSPIFQD